MAFNILEQPRDVQEYIYNEWLDADLFMQKGEIYCNTLGKVYVVLEDSLPGNIYVKVSNAQLEGRAISRLVPKTILVS